MAGVIEFPVPGNITRTSSTNQSIASAAVVNLNPAAGIIRAVSIGGTAGGGAGNLEFGLSDVPGNTFLEKSMSAGTKGTISYFPTDSTLYAYIRNGNANSSTYSYMAADYTL